MKAPFFLLWGFIVAGPAWAETGKAVEVFPSTPFYQDIIYETLAVFWIAIIGLIVIIRMKLREIERVQKMKLDAPRKEPPAPNGGQQTVRDKLP